jgi:hypothetical protein
MNAKLYEDEKDRAMYLHAISSFARENSIPENEVRRIYEAELEKLKAVARIKDFLMPLIERRVRDVIRHTGGHLHGQLTSSGEVL